MGYILMLYKRNEITIFTQIVLFRSGPFITTLSLKIWQRPSWILFLLFSKTYVWQTDVHLTTQSRSKITSQIAAVMIVTLSQYSLLLTVRCTHVKNFIYVHLSLIPTLNLITLFVTVGPKVLTQISQTLVVCDCRCIYTTDDSLYT